MLEGASANEYGDDMGHEGSAGVHEYADKNGDHRKRYDVDMKHAMADHQRGQNGEDHDEGVKHSRGSHLLEIVSSEEG